MDTPYSKRTAREALGLITDSALAEFFGVSRAAVAQWAEDEPLPQRRREQLELHLLKTSSGSVV